MSISLSSPSLSFFSSSSIFHPLSANPKSLIPFSTNLYTLKTSSAIRSELTTATLPILNFSGETLPNTATLTLVSAPPSTARAIVHRAIVHDQQNARRGTASTLTRAEVRGGGKKPFQQKKTGRARRGSQRTPLRPGGGVVFGPKPKDWSIKMNRKEKRLSISTAIASAAKSEDAFVVEEFGEEFEKVGPKTREFVEAMKRWGLDPCEKAMFLMMDVPDKVMLSCRNIGTIKMLTPRTLNLFDILDSEKLVLTEGAVEYLNAMYGEESVEEDVDEEEETNDGDEVPVVDGSS